MQQLFQSCYLLCKYLLLQILQTILALHLGVQHSSYHHQQNLIFLIHVVVPHLFRSLLENLEISELDKNHHKFCNQKPVFELLGPSLHNRDSNKNSGQKYPRSRHSRNASFLFVPMGIIPECSTEQQLEKNLSTHHVWISSRTGLVFHTLCCSSTCTFSSFVESSLANLVQLICCFTFVL